MSERPKFVYVFDQNRRVYIKDGGSHGPVWREHWRKREIVGETRVSWIDSYGNKHPKRGTLPYFNTSAFFAKDEVEAERIIADREWVEVHRYKIASALQFGHFTPEVLRQVAALVGYEP